MDAYPDLLDNINHCFALHVGNFMETGTVTIPLKYVTANTNSVTIEVFGTSAHSLAPHAGIDANYIGCQIMQDIYSIKTRIIAPETKMSITIPLVEGGKKVSAISDYFKCRASIRDHDPFEHKKVLKHI